MSPASQPGLERYIGSYLISSAHHRPPNYPQHPTLERKPPYHPPFRSPAYAPQPAIFQPPPPQGAPPFCPNAGWAGVPLISTANRRPRKVQTTQSSPASYRPQVSSPQNPPANVDFAEGPHLPLSRLALHTQGAPLILSRRYGNNKKQNQYQNKPFSSPGPKCISADFKRQKETSGHFDYKEQNNNNLRIPSASVGSNMSNADSLSVASDESSSSAHSETCLPRIIKPRKRRKKDRKPPQGDAADKTNGDDKVERRDATNASLSSFSSSNGHDRKHFNAFVNPKVDQVYRVSNNNRVDDIKTESVKNDLNSEDDDSDDSSSLFEAISRCSPAVCQCRYCDPRGNLWESTTIFPSPCDKDVPLRRSWSEPCSGYSVESLRISDYDKASTPHRSDPSMTVNFEGQETSDRPKGGVGVIGAGRASSISETVETPSSLDWKGDLVSQVQLVPESFFKTFSSHGMVNLEVSSAIVTSLNGHRDLEIKFFSSSPTSASSKDNFLFPSVKNEDIATSDLQQTVLVVQ